MLWRQYRDERPALAGDYVLTSSGGPRCFGIFVELCMVFWNTQSVTEVRGRGVFVRGMVG